MCSKRDTPFRSHAATIFFGNSICVEIKSPSKIPTKLITASIPTNSRSSSLESCILVSITSTVGNTKSDLARSR